MAAFEFRHRYRIPSIRLPDRDYAKPGLYFVTICTKFRTPWFGEIQNGIMSLSNIGIIIDEEWRNIPLMRSYVSLDEYVVMPDHFHGIIRIHAHDQMSAPNAIDPSNVETPFMGVSVLTTNNPHQHWKKGCLGSIVNQFKRACTYRIKCAGNEDFAWQTRYHESVVRRDAAEKIRRYIGMNPKNHLTHLHNYL